MTTTYKEIRSDGTGDYVTIHLAEAGISAATTSTPMSGPWVFVVNNEIITETVPTNWTDGFSGQSASNYVALQPDFVGSGATGSSNTDCSFAGNHNYSGADVLDFDGNAGKGAGFYLGNSNIGFAGWTIVQDLQWWWDSSAGIEYINPSTQYSGSFGVFARCIVRSENPYGNLAVSWQDLGSGAGVISNCLIFSTNENSSISQGNGVLFGNVNPYVINNTICISRYKAGASATQVLSVNNSSPTYFGNAIYTFDASGDPFAAYFGATWTSDGYNIASNANGTALAGTADITTGNITNDFNTADIHTGNATDAVDFRPKTGSALIAYIPSGSRFTSLPSYATGYNDKDIRGQTRVGVANDCGCFQTVAAAPSGFAHSFGAIFG